jgi:hypothetical protein
MKVKIKNLHHSYQPMNILRSLNDQGLQALNATPKLKWKTKELLVMFIVSFHRNTDINKIFNIKTICRAALSVEPIRTHKLIPQCKICQSFGTRNYSNKAPKCVKCAGPHLTSECDKPQTAQWKCCHCGITQQVIEVARLLKLSKNLEVTGINQNNKRRQFFFPLSLFIKNSNLVLH